ncbi:MAG: tRNA preQ1(34) S-adenosylmethionine ribosyltransferase-isomerase QueA, partial [Candidatus Peregrinibacteria bacterium]
PTPPYIKQPVQNSNDYQTIYARHDGSAAAPTAGFHFTQRVFEALKARGIGMEFVTLHVGLGTFAPVKTEDITQHQIHSEWFELSPDVANRLNAAKKAGKRIVAVGTTSVRVLESCADLPAGRQGESGTLHPQTTETQLFIYPGYRFKFVDQMVTNFHVPKSSLLMLVSAFANREFILKSYELAKQSGYRFFSFGDVMWIH